MTLVPEKSLADYAAEARTELLHTYADVGAEDQHRNLMGKGVRGSTDRCADRSIAASLIVQNGLLDEANATVSSPGSTRRSSTARSLERSPARWGSPPRTPTETAVPRDPTLPADRTRVHGRRQGLRDRAADRTRHAHRRRRAHDPSQAHARRPVVQRQRRRAPPRGEHRALAPPAERAVPGRSEIGGGAS